MTSPVQVQTTWSSGSLCHSAGSLQTQGFQTVQKKKQKKIYFTNAEHQVAETQTKTDLAKAQTTANATL